MTLSYNLEYALPPYREVPCSCGCGAIVRTRSKTAVVYAVGCRQRKARERQARYHATPPSTTPTPPTSPPPTIAAPCPAIRQIGVTLVLETDGIGGLVWEDVI
jgi:hypothetical protein